MFKQNVFDLSKSIIFAFAGSLVVLAIFALALPKEAQAERCLLYTSDAADEV